MAEKIRFHLDEHMDPDIAVALRKYGVDVTTTPEQRLRGDEDPAHLQRGRDQGRVVVTDDSDFLRLISATTDHAGVVFCRRRWHSLGEIIRFLLLVHEVYEPKDMTGRVEFL